MKNKFYALVILFISTGYASLYAADPTVITLSDTPLRQNIKPMGLNLGGDSYYNGSIILKERIRNGNFEGTEYRTLRNMCGGEDGSFYSYKNYYESWTHILEGATYRIITGADKGKTGGINKVSRDVWTNAKHPKFQGKDISRYAISGESLSNPDADFVMITDKVYDVGFIGQHGDSYWVFCEGSGTIVTEKDDNPPESKGHHVAVLTAGDGHVDLSAPCAMTQWIDVSGRWNLTFWAKGKGDLTVALGEWGLPKPHKREGLLQKKVALSSEWTHHTLQFDVADYPYDTMCLHFELTSGQCKLDDLSFIQEGNTNPTAFRDVVVTQLKKLHPGSLRFLQIGGSSMDNYLRPRETRRAYSAARNQNPVKGNVWPGHPHASGNASIYSYGLVELLELCQEVGADPWVCIPGIIYEEEVAHLMEFLGGPVTSKYGALRAEQGQSEPWTEVFDLIHIEFGNEAWNHAAAYNHRGYNGPEYWHDLMASGKSSPYYNESIQFQVGGQAVATGRSVEILRDKQAADGFAVAPYIIHEMSQEQEAQSSEEIWSWVFG